MLEITTSWKGEVLSVAYVERIASTRELGIPWDVPIPPGTTNAGPLVVHARVVERAPPLPKGRARTDLPMALAFAIGAHATLFAFGLWSYRLAPPIDDVETMRSFMSNDRVVVTSRPEDDPQFVEAEPAPPEIATGLPATSDSPMVRYSARPKLEDRESALREAAEFGMIGLLSVEGVPVAADWGPAAIGDGIFKDDPGGGFMPAPTFGIGAGEGGGGRGEGIGLGNITAFGGGGPHHVPIPKFRPPQVKIQQPIVSVTCKSQSYIDAIRAVVESNMNHIRDCYRIGLARDPALEGTVRVKFVIERTGKVSTAIDDGSTMPDPIVTRCIVGVFASMDFPEHHGIGYATYPIRLSRPD